jgi:hypothetical protein
MVTPFTGAWIETHTKDQKPNDPGERQGRGCLYGIVGHTLTATLLIFQKKCQ